MHLVMKGSTFEKQQLSEKRIKENKREHLVLSAEPALITS